MEEVKKMMMMMMMILLAANGDAIMKRSKEAIGCQTQKRTECLVHGVGRFSSAAICFAQGFPACYQVDGHIWVGFDLCPDVDQKDE